MPAEIKPAAIRELHYTVPKELKEIFMKEWRVIGPWPPAPGYWPIDPHILLEGGLLEKLAANPEFNRQYQLVIMPKMTVGG